MNPMQGSAVEGIRGVDSLDTLAEFMGGLGYAARPQAIYLPDLDLPEGGASRIQELSLLADYGRDFQIYYAKTTSMRRTDFRQILEPFYRRYPQGDYLFIFTTNWEEIAFVSPQRVAVEPGKTKLRLRILLIDPGNVYHTDLEVLNSITILPTEQRAEIIWQKHLDAFNVERVTKEFFEAYESALKTIREELTAQNKASHQEVHAFAQQLLSRIMFLYFVQKKEWLKWKDYVQDERYIKNLREKSLLC